MPPVHGPAVQDGNEKNAVVVAAEVLGDNGRHSPQPAVVVFLPMSHYRSISHHHRKVEHSKLVEHYAMGDAVRGEGWRREGVEMVRVLGSHRGEMPHRSVSQISYELGP